MRKFYFFLISAALIPFSVLAQSPSSWNYGIAAHYSFERYKITSLSFVTDQPNSTFEQAGKSALVLGGGIWAERPLNKLLSLYSRLDYHMVRADEELITGPTSKVGGGYPYQEWHNSLSLALHGRFYFPTKSKLKIHVDGGLKAEKIFMFRSRHAHFDYRQWNPQYYNAIVPGLVGGIGVQHGRFGFSLEYQTFPWNDALTKYMATSERMSFYKRDISRRNFTLNATFRLNRF
jgi:hypothetical protein